MQDVKQYSSSDCVQPSLLQILYVYKKGGCAAIPVRFNCLREAVKTAVLIACVRRLLDIATGVNNWLVKVVVAYGCVCSVYGRC